MSMTLFEFLGRVRLLSEAVDKRKLRLPTVDEILYVDPMKGRFKGKGRRCDNCMMWMSDAQRCGIHGPKIEIKAGNVCNYQIPGAPMPGKWKDHPGGMEYVKPRLSGLIEGPVGGTRCGNCRYRSGDRCDIVGGADGKRVKIDPYGCCNRWEER